MDKQAPDRISIGGVEYVRADAARAETSANRKPQPHMVERTCKWCKGKFQARAVDVKRGWAKFCSKSCKAKEQEKRTGQYRALQDGDYLSDDERRERDHQQALYESTSCHGQDPGEGFF